MRLGGGYNGKNMRRYLSPAAQRACGGGIVNSDTLKKINSIMKNISPRIFITPGEPAGIGPDITIKSAQAEWPAELIAICDPDLLLQRAKLLDIHLKLNEFDPKNPSTAHQPGSLKIIPVRLKAPAIPGKLDVLNASYVLQCLETALDNCLNPTDALVTGPIHKGLLNDAGIPFTGHTEFLAQRLHCPEVIMLFVIDNLKVALVTTHLPLSQVPAAITQEKLIQIIRLLDKELKYRFAIHQPRILVCGLNPHAGENGHLGREEIDTITPALQKLIAENIHVTGPLPADTIFTEKYLKNTDAILAMYHDQALPVVKYLGFNHAVNVTLGLPIIRTSVDHGTALDIAGTHQADAGSLSAAIQLAIDLA
jgi:4-hydroxythreonine-4-phosphate dehydrogenase